MRSERVPRLGVLQRAGRALPRPGRPCPRKHKESGSAVVDFVMVGALVVFALKFMVGTPDKLAMWKESQLAPYFESMATWGYQQLPADAHKWIENNLKGEKNQTNNAAAKPDPQSTGVLHAVPAQPTSGVEEPTLNGLESTQ